MGTQRTSQRCINAARQHKQPCLSSPSYSSALYCCHQHWHRNSFQLIAMDCPLHPCMTCDMPAATQPNTTHVHLQPHMCNPMRPSLPPQILDLDNVTGSVLVGAKGAVSFENMIIQVGLVFAPSQLLTLHPGAPRRCTRKVCATQVIQGVLCFASAFSCSQPLGSTLDMGSARRTYCIIQAMHMNLGAAVTA